jgi:hypothetical protein
LAHLSRGNLETFPFLWQIFGFCRGRKEVFKERLSQVSPKRRNLTMGEKRVKIKIVKPRIPKRVICPTCWMKQKFKKKKGHWKTVKDIDVTVFSIIED